METSNVCCTFDMHQHLNGKLNVLVHIFEPLFPPIVFLLELRSNHAARRV